MLGSIMSHDGNCVHHTVSIKPYRQGIEKPSVVGRELRKNVAILIFEHFVCVYFAICHETALEVFIHKKRNVFPHVDRVHI